MANLFTNDERKVTMNAILHPRGKVPNAVPAVHRDDFVAIRRARAFLWHKNLSTKKDHFQVFKSFNQLSNFQTIFKLIIKKRHIIAFNFFFTNRDYKNLVCLLLHHQFQFSTFYKLISLHTN